VATSTAGRGAGDAALLPPQPPKVKSQTLSSAFDAAWSSEDVKDMRSTDQMKSDAPADPLVEGVDRHTGAPSR